MVWFAFDWLIEYWLPDIDGDCIRPVDLAINDAIVSELWKGCARPGSQFHVIPIYWNISRRDFWLVSGLFGMPVKIVAGIKTNAKQTLSSQTEL